MCHSRIYIYICMEYGLWLNINISHDPPAFLKKRRAFVRKVRLNETPCLSLLMLAATAWNTEPPTSPHFQHQHMVTNRSPQAFPIGCRPSLTSFHSLDACSPHTGVSHPGFNHSDDREVRPLQTHAPQKLLFTPRNLMPNFWVWIGVVLFYYGGL